ncbi:hypothetical protein D3C72_507870 [compost metagenome]
MTPDAPAPTPRLPWMRAVLAAGATVGLAAVMQTALMWAPTDRPDAAENGLRGLFLLAPVGLWPGYAIAGLARRGLFAVAGGFASAIGTALIIGAVAALTSTGDVQPASSFALGIVLAYPLGTLLAAVCAACDVLLQLLGRPRRQAGGAA